MPRQLAVGSGALPAEAYTGASGDSRAESDGWESVDNKRKPKHQGALNVQSARLAPQNTHQQQLMMWREGMTLSVGRTLPGGANARASLTAFRAAGTVAEPKVCWNMAIQGFDHALIADCEALVRAEARKLDCSMVVIREHDLSGRFSTRGSMTSWQQFGIKVSWKSPMGKACANSVLGDDDLSFWLTNIHFVCRGDVHNTTRSRDANGEIILVEDPRNSQRKVAQVEQVDDHLTVFMGISLDDVRVQGHVFVQLEHFGQYPNPPHPKSFREMSTRYKNRTLRIKGKLPREDRQHVQPGHGNWSEEFFELGSALSSNRRNHEILERIRAQYPPGMRVRQDLL